MTIHARSRAIMPFLLAVTTMLSACSKSGTEPSKSTSFEPPSTSASTDSAALPSGQPSPRAGSAAMAPKAPVPELDVCERLRKQRRYVSEKEIDCGPPVDGYPSPRCHSELTFSENTYSWRHTDMVFSGEYSCNGREVRGDGHGGTYDPDTGHIVWEGMKYLPKGA